MGSCQEKIRKIEQKSAGSNMGFPEVCQVFLLILTGYASSYKISELYLMSDFHSEGDVPVTRSLRNQIYSLKACYSLFRIKTAENFQYRLAGIAGATTSIFYAVIEILVYSIFYHYAENKTGGLLASLSLRQVVTYQWLAQFLFLMQPMSVDTEILGKITGGDVGIELCRPLDLYSHWFAKVAAGRLSPLMWRGSGVLVAGMLMPPAYRMSPPASLLHFLLMLISLFSAFLLCTAYGMLACTIRLNVDWGDGPLYMILLAGGVLSGTYLPLQLWPDFMQKFLLLQPFAGYLDIPARFYLGVLNLQDGLWAIGMQVFWITVFILAGRLLMNRQLKKVIVQGG